MFNGHAVGSQRNLFVSPNVSSVSLSSRLLMPPPNIPQTFSPLLSVPSFAGERLRGHGKARFERGRQVVGFPPAAATFRRK